MIKEMIEEMVKEMSERTNVGMMECNRALEASKGDMELAIEELRKAGIAKAGKKAGRIAAEGAIVILAKAPGKQSVMLEVNSETDFVARDENFTRFVDAVAATALKANEQDVEALAKSSLNGSEPTTVEEVRQELVAKIGENVQIRRLVLSNPEAPFVGSYVHGNRIGVMVELDTENEELARDIAMHIAANKPMVISPDAVPASVIEKEKEIFTAQAAASGKPQDIIEKMVIGRMKKYLDEVSLMGQPFVKDPDITVGSLLNKHRTKVLAFYRYEVGEGIEKVTEDFREAVMSQAQAAR